jgi:hypothetical protein
MAGEVTEVVDCLPSKCVVLSSNTSTDKEKSKEASYDYMSSLSYLCALL